MSPQRKFCLILALSLAAVLPARAETSVLVAHLSGAAEVPAITTAAHGEAQFTYDSDTRQLTYSVSYSGVVGTSVDLHGPAAKSEDANIVVSFPIPDSPVSGMATLTDGQAAQLLAGRWYIDVHSDAHPTGEIRGQIVKP